MLLALLAAPCGSLAAAAGAAAGAAGPTYPTLLIDANGPDSLLHQPQMARPTLVALDARTLALSNGLLERVFMTAPDCWPARPLAGPSQLPARDITASMQLTAWAAGSIQHPTCGVGPTDSI